MNVRELNRPEEGYFTNANKKNCLKKVVFESAKKVGCVFSKLLGSLVFFFKKKQEEDSSLIRDKDPSSSEEEESSEGSLSSNNSTSSGGVDSSPRPESDETD
jgi:hypothetical protein